MIPPQVQNGPLLQKLEKKVLLGFWMLLSTSAAQEDAAILYEGIWSGGEVMMVLHQNARCHYLDYRSDLFVEIQGGWRVEKQSLVITPEKVRVNEEGVQPFPKEVSGEYRFKLNTDNPDRPTLKMNDITLRRTPYKVPDPEEWPETLTDNPDTSPRHPQISHLYFEPLRSLDLKVTLDEEDQLELHISTQRPLNQKCLLTLWEFNAPDYAWRIELDMSVPDRRLRYGEASKLDLQLIPDENRTPRPLSKKARFFARVELHYLLLFPPGKKKDVIVGIYGFTEEGELILIDDLKRSF
ncbi:MAG: hypothetical protein WD708_09535 [Kiritimatiellia bacterium]